MNSDSKTSARGSRAVSSLVRYWTPEEHSAGLCTEKEIGKPKFQAEAILPNSCEYFKLLEVRIVGEGQMAKSVDKSLDIIGWMIRFGRPIPITVFGVHEPKGGCFYALLDLRDKTHTELDGTQYADYKSFMADKWRAFDQAAAEPEVHSPEPPPAAQRAVARPHSGPRVFKDPASKSHPSWDLK